MKLSPISSPPFISPPVAQRPPLYRHYFLLICIFYAVMASMLAIRVRYGIMDEDFHLAASKSFANGGVNKTTLYHHVPPTGVASHIWFAFWLRIFPEINYMGLRLLSCVTLGVLAVFTFFQLKTIRPALQKTVLAATLVMLACPYFFLSVATLMTEGPSLLFMGAGLLFLFVSRFQHLLLFGLACLLLGLATIARFYFIPLLPTLFIILLLSDWQRYRQSSVQASLSRRMGMYFLIVISLLPLGGLILLWGGLTPPEFNRWSELRLGLSFNPFRPLSALAMVGIYTAPFILVNVDWKADLLSRNVMVTFLLAFLLALFRVNLFHDPLSIKTVFSGPIEHSLAWLHTKSDQAFVLGLFFFYGLGISSLILITQRIIYFTARRDFSNKGLVFSIIFVGLFLISQAFVGGNHPFYDRYLIHPWPFIGYLVACLLPTFLNARTYLVLTGYTVLSVLILTKWGI